MSDTKDRPYAAEEVMSEAWFGGQRERVLAEEVAGKEANLQAMVKQSTDLIEELREVKASREEVLEVLLRYGGHDTGCRWPGLKCCCGFVDAIAKARRSS